METRKVNEITLDYQILHISHARVLYKSIEAYYDTTPRFHDFPLYTPITQMLYGAGIFTYIWMIDMVNVGKIYSAWSMGYDLIH